MVDLIQDANKYLSSETKSKNLIIQKVAQYDTKILRIFGVGEGNDSNCFTDSGNVQGGSKEMRWGIGDRRGLCVCLVDFYK